MRINRGYSNPPKSRGVSACYFVPFQGPLGKISKTTIFNGTKSTNEFEISPLSTVEKPRQGRFGARLAEVFEGQAARGFGGWVVGWGYLPMWFTWKWHSAIGDFGWKPSLTRFFMQNLRGGWSICQLLTYLFWGLRHPFLKNISSIFYGWNQKGVSFWSHMG